MDKKEFVVAALDSKHKTFIVHVASLSFVASPSFSPLNIYPLCRSQIAGLIAKEAPIKVLAKYLDFVDIFFLDLTSKLFKYIKINKHTIKLVNGQQTLYRPIYSLEPVELEILKVYIEINLVNKFIKPSKSLAGTSVIMWP